MKLENAKVGDRLFCRTRYGWTVYTVSKLTKTQVVANSGTHEARFKKETGRKIGAANYRTAEIFTEKHQAIVDAYKLQKNLERVIESLKSNINKLTGDDLDILLSIKGRITQ